MFGLFQYDEACYPPHIHDFATRFAHARRTLHGVLFLFKEPRSAMLAYRLQQYMMWNPALVNPAAVEEWRARKIPADISAAIPCRRAAAE